FTLVFRGREMSHKEMGDKMLRRIAEDLSNVGSVEKAISFEGRFMIMIMAPGAAKQPAKEQAANPEQKRETSQPAAESTKEGSDAETKIE
ncbi:MAG: translation initiation factor IF-3 C-terminal domain-containing protein, partial [Chitinivibrionia bacterium]|nr:translation initiation factor IF-3 C-terminal domain-containing protein [Chitinivibrionia bacterium]